MERIRKRGQGSSWAVVPAEEEEENDMLSVTHCLYVLYVYLYDFSRIGYYGDNFYYFVFVILVATVGVWYG